jgi:purine-binding chemotaxis protein CheW
MQLVVFCLDGQRYGLPLAMVERIVRAVEVTPLPEAPAIVLGAIDVGGQVLPVLSIRWRLHLPEREISPAHQFLIGHTGRRTVVLVIDEVQEVIEVPDLDIVYSAEILPGLDQTRGVVKLADGLLLIQDLEKFLSLDEEHAVDKALNEAAHYGA